MIQIRMDLTLFDLDLIHVVAQGASVNEQIEPMPPDIIHLLYFHLHLPSSSSSP